MAILTFNPPIGPSPGTRTTPKVKLREAEFGDGYELSMPDGINNIRMSLSLKWEGLTEAQMQTIWGFVVARRGSEPFYYQPAGEAAPQVWTCKEFDRALDEGIWVMSMTLVEYFGAV